MFSKPFSATVQHLRLKRKSQDDGGDLLVDVTLGALLNKDMASDLSDQIVALFDSEEMFQNLTVKNMVDGLIVELWHEDQDPVTIDPYLSLTQVSTKKYRLDKEPETHATLFSINLKTAPLKETDLLRLIHCLGCQVQVNIDFAQQGLPLDQPIKSAQQENDALDDDEEDTFA
jgi:hypothetical protein